MRQKRLTFIMVCVFLASLTVPAFMSAQIGPSEGPIDYPIGADTDKEKLACAYALVQEAITEYNGVSASVRGRLTLVEVPKDESEYAKAVADGLIREWVPAGYMVARTPENLSLRQKFKTYSIWAKATFNLLLRERTRVKQEIIDASYTRQEWTTIEALPDNLYGPYELGLFGNKTMLKDEPTLATSANLTAFKTIDFDALTETPLTDPYEDYTTYTEYDETTEVTVAENLITFAQPNPRDEQFYVRKDFGAGYFGLDFEARYQWYQDYNQYAYYHCCVFTVDADVDEDLYDARQDAYTAAYDMRYWGGSAPYSFRLYSYWGATSDTADTCNNCWEQDKWYYEVMYRDDDDGTYGSLTLYHAEDDYYDQPGTDLIDTLYVDFDFGKTDYRYCWALSSYDDGVGGLYIADGFVRYHELWRETVAGGNTTSFGYILGGL